MTIDPFKLYILNSLTMRIIFEETNRRVTRATEMANRLLGDNDFFQQISEHLSFDFSTASPAQIASLIQNSNLQFHVDLFYPNLLDSLLKYRKTLAYTDKRWPNTLFLNIRKLKRSPESIAATIIHESIHALDREAIDYTFGHGNNSSVGKENSAPYWIGNLAYKILKNDRQAPNLVFDQPEDDDNASDTLADI